MAEEALPNAEIARRLHVSEQSAKSYLARVCAAIGCHSRHELFIRWHSGLKEELAAITPPIRSKSKKRRFYRVAGLGLCDNCVRASHYSCDATHCNCICNELIAEDEAVHAPQPHSPESLCA